jgi:nucleoside phosphorylase
MTSDEKRALLLLKSVIFHYHGLDEDEQKLLDETAKQLDAQDELRWANEFISKDYLSAFERAREYLNGTIATYDKEKRLKYLDMVWKANNKKGYITEMEATAMLKLAKDWQVENELIEMVKK